MTCGPHKKRRSRFFFYRDDLASSGWSVLRKFALGHQVSIKLYVCFFFFRYVYNFVLHVIRYYILVDDHLYGPDSIWIRNFASTDFPSTLTDYGRMEKHERQSVDDRFSVSHISSSRPPVNRENRLFHD